jgi:hypothetical protein
MTVGELHLVGRPVEFVQGIPIDLEKDSYIDPSVRNMIVLDGWFHVCFYNDFYYYLYYFYRVPIVLWVIKQYPINLAL